MADIDHITLKVQQADGTYQTTDYDLKDTDGRNSKNITYSNTTSGLTASNVQSAVDELVTKKQDSLAFDDAPTTNSSNPVKSSGIKTAIDAKADSSALASEVTRAKAAEQANTDAIAKKQNTLTFDTAPTSGSTNPVTSNGVYTADKANSDAIAKKQDKLTFDTTPTANSTNPVTSGGIKTALNAKQNRLTFDSTPTASSTNPVTSGGVKAALDTKQNTLTFDTAPTSGSTNPVTSGGIYSANKTNSDAISAEVSRAKAAEEVNATAITKKQDTLTFDTTPTANSTNPVTSGGIKTALDAKQNTLTFDTAPTEGSSNPVTSDGIWNALQTAKGLELAFRHWCEINRDGKIYSTKFYHYSVNTTSAGVKADANTNLTCTPYTDTTEGTDDYEDIPLFKWWHCNYTRDDDSFARLTALEGTPGYKTTGAVDVGALHMTMYIKYEDLGDMYKISVSDTQYDGFYPFRSAKRENGDVEPYFILSSYAVSLVNGLPYSLPNVSPEAFWSYNRIMTTFPKKGTGYHGAGIAYQFYGLLLLWIKYATQNSQTVCAGVTNYNAQVKVAKTETSATRVLIASNSTFVVGGCISVGDPGSNTNLDRGNSYMHNLANRVRVKSIETVTVDGTSYMALNIDSTITTTSTTYVTTMPSYTGWTDDVIGHHDGSPVSNTDGKHPFRLGGVEYGIGALFIFSDMAMEFQSDHSKNVLICDPWTVRTNSSLTSNGFTKIGNIPNVGTGDDWWIGELAIDVEHCASWPSVKGGGSGVGVGDYVWAGGVASSGYREWLLFGALWDGLNCGLSDLYCWDDLSGANWARVAGD